MILAASSFRAVRRFHGIAATTPVTPYVSALSFALRMQQQSSSGLSRTWNATENWCSLCKEPFNSWNEHRGKRDHICLEMVFDAVIKYPHRNWAPMDVWEQVASVMNMSPTPEGLHDHGGDRARTTARHQRLLRVYDRSETARRRDLLLALRVLVDEQLLIFDHDRLRQSPLSRINIGLHGALVMFKRLFPPLIGMFPSAEAKDISGMTQMVSASYNLETVFELCALESLLTKKEIQARVSRPAAGDDGGIGGEFAGGGSAPFDSEEARAAARAGELSYFMKGVIVRSIFGQLRWMTEDGAIECPFTERKIPPYLNIIGEFACDALLAEIITCKICEYVCRVEQVWRDEGAPRTIQSTLPAPNLSNHGMLGYMHGRFTHPDFGAFLRSDPTKLVGIQPPKVFFHDLGKKKM